jgi:hypothetical protein
MGIHVDTKQPSKFMLLLSLLIVILGVVGHYARIPYITQYHFWVVVLGYVVLLLGTLY